jgi:predicted site-specific integrase-resolvase
LGLCQSGTISEVVVAYRDRLCRFAFELFEWFFQYNKVKLLVLNKEMDASGNTELAEDLLSIIHVFNCREQGKRKYKKRASKETKSEEKESTS